jgi:ParB family chromosome partitioning protein
VVKKVNEKRTANSKDLRKLRTILPDPVAWAHFLSESGDLESAQFRIRVVEKKHDDQSLSELGAAVDAMKSVPWTTLQGLKGDETVLKKFDEAESLLRSLRKALTSD